MATQPKPPDSPSPPPPNPAPSPTPPPDLPHPDDQTKSREERAAKLKSAPPILHEGLALSREIELKGASEYMREHDMRPKEQQPVLKKNVLPVGDTLDTPAEGQKQVTGVSIPVKEDGKAA